jgi:D-3-phosphoglycerate dehydrogenase
MKRGSFEAPDKAAVMNFRVVLTDPDVHPPDPALEANLARCGARLEARLCATELERKDFCGGADAVLCGRSQITRTVIQNLPGCRIISRLGTGVDNIDLNAAGEAGIPVTNVPEFCTVEVAEHTLALILACRRKLLQLAQQTRQGIWRSDAVMPAHRLSGQTLGLVGLGRIGRAVAERAVALGMRILFFDPVVSEGTGSRLLKCTTLAQLLGQADVVSLHLPLTEQTRGLMGKAAFDEMKPGAVLINCARGPIVVEEELVRALQSGRLAAAGLDTLAQEPPATDSPLVGLPNVITTPHCAAHTVEALADVRRQAYAEVVRALCGEALVNVVNGQCLRKKQVAARGKSRIKSKGKNA